MHQIRQYLDILNEALEEAPLVDFGLHGDTEKEGSLRPDDLKAIKNPKWLKKVGTAFSRSPYRWNIYLYNGRDGQIDLGGQRVTDRVDARNLANLDQWNGVHPPERIKQMFGITPPDIANSISVVIIENEGGDRMPLTPWMLAHRIVHAAFYATPSQGLSRRGVPAIGLADQKISKWFNGVMNLAIDIFEDAGMVPEDFPATTRLVAKHIGTMKSVKNLTSPGEFMVELIVQNLIQGTIRFHHPKLAKPFRPRTTYVSLVQTTAVPLATADDFYGLLDKFAEFGNQLCNDLWDACVGNIFVL